MGNSQEWNFEDIKGNDSKEEKKGVIQRADDSLPPWWIHTELNNLIRFLKTFTEGSGMGVGRAEGQTELNLARKVKDDQQRLLVGLVF